MSGTFSAKVLASGTLPTTIGDLYTVPALTQTIIKGITLVSTASGSVIINLYVNDGGQRRIIPKDLEFGAAYLLETDVVYTLAAGEKIQGYCDTLSTVDFTIHGVEEV